MENLFDSVCVYAFHFYSVKVPNRGMFVILVVIMMMATMTTMMIMIKKHCFDDNDYNEGSVISDSSSKFLQVCC